MADTTLWTRALVRVGDGLGFVIGLPAARYVVTAAHCLPQSLAAAGGLAEMAPSHERLIGAFGDRGDLRAAACLFADWIGDIAVLKPADRSFDGFGFGLNLGARPPHDGQLAAWLPSLDGTWFRCRARFVAHRLWFMDAARDMVAGMSGAPIISESGDAIGVLCACDASKRRGGPNPTLGGNLPGWLLWELRA